MCRAWTKLALPFGGTPYFQRVSSACGAARQFESDEDTQPRMSAGVALPLARHRAGIAPGWRHFGNSGGSPVFVSSTRNSPASKPTPILAQRHYLTLAHAGVESVHGQVAVLGVPLPGASRARCNSDGSPRPSPSRSACARAPASPRRRARTWCALPRPAPFHSSGTIPRRGVVQPRGGSARARRPWPAPGPFAASRPPGAARRGPGWRGCASRCTPRTGCGQTRAAASRTWGKAPGRRARRCAGDGGPGPTVRRFSMHGSHWLRWGAGGRFPHLRRRPFAVRSATRQ